MAKVGAGSCLGALSPKASHSTSPRASAACDLPGRARDGVPLYPLRTLFSALLRHGVKCSWFSSSGGTLVAAQDAQEVRDFAEVGEGVLRSFFADMAAEVQVEEVFPRPAPQRTRFKLRQVNIAQREN